eukprot:CAMPEP_0114313824 /NCGR_PEP_ID=MMETSP0059-20121206/21381_1 /TAXON_ID=36894 /ORGANISM="Pyramimonas parkeae, Strain CCMP726" /LENGTH=72 /DNA_ID=CAMNT_0001438725 /DNA_START=77 /DNA_END=292 /DNA_ORIENTATION=-
MDMFDLQDHPTLTAAPFPERGVKTTLVLKPLAFADRLRGDAPSVRYDHEDGSVSVVEPVVGTAAAGAGAARS